MQYLDLFQNTGNPMRVSQISLGCDYYGLTIPEEVAFRMMDAYYELGGTFFDTARVYGQAELGAQSLSEVTVGRWIRRNGLQGRVVFSDKGGHPDRRDMSVSRISEKELREDLFASLDALQASAVDIWFLHRDNPAMPVGEIVDMVSGFVEQGYIKHLGASNWTSKRLAEAREYAQRHGKHGFEISQIQWSLARSTPQSWNDPSLVAMDETELAWYKQNKLPVMVFSPQARGLFSKVIEQGVEAVPKKTAERFLLEQNADRIENCRAVCGRTGHSPAGMCLAYLTSAPFPTIPVIGGSNPGQVRGALKDCDIKLSDKDRAFLTK